jgi:hypothetical protein
MIFKRVGGNLVKQTLRGAESGSETSVISGIGDKTMDNHTWPTSALAISRRISWCYDEIKWEENDKQKQNIFGKASNKFTLQRAPISTDS